MISTSIHGVTRLTITEPLSMVSLGSGPYYVRTLTLATQQGKKCTIELFGDSPEALAATDAETDYWRTQAAEESARADKAQAWADRWRNSHAELYVASEADRQRAKAAEQRLAALQDLLHKACDASGERIEQGVNP